MLRRASLNALFLSLLALSSSASDEIQPPTLADLGKVPLLDLEGHQHSLAELRGDGPLVIAYTGVGCPISQKYAARLTRLAAAYGERRAVLGSQRLTAGRSGIDRQGARRAELGIPLVKDLRQLLTRGLGATTTTEVFVFDAKGALRYRGAVDDQYSLGAARPAPTKDYLVDALAAVLVGKEAPVESTPAPGCKLTLLPDDEQPEEVTWSSHVAAIVQNNCEVCHRPGQAGPFALQSYDKARGWGEMIAEVVKEGRMPPWNATEEFDGHFANERKLSPTERKRLLTWIERGMPRGNPAEDPKPLVWTEGWTIGEPDAVFEMQFHGPRGKKPIPEAGFKVPREGVVEYKYFSTPTNYSEDRWVQALEVRAGTPDVVHHVLVLLDDPNAPQGSQQLDFRSYFAVAVPGDTSVVYPEGYGKRLPAGATLVFQLHYTPNGKRRFDRSSVGLVFCDEPPQLEVVTSAIVNDRFRIPPGAENHEVRAEVMLREETAVLAFFPHMHTRGADFRYVAHYPDGGSEDLLVSDYNFNWQEAYVLHDPLLLPEGSRIECIGHFDNSVENPDNPDPKATVHWGDQTFEEMFIGYYDTVRLIEQ